VSVSLITKERHGTWMWRCADTARCKMAGSGLRSVTAAIREADRHNREMHQPHDRRHSACNPCAVYSHL
jgi:hypothetical protein